MEFYFFLLPLQKNFDTMIWEMQKNYLLHMVSD